MFGKRVLLLHFRVIKCYPACPLITNRRYTCVCEALERVAGFRPPDWAPAPEWMPTCSPSDFHGGAFPHSSEFPHKRGTIVDSKCWFRPNSLLKTCDWFLFFDAEVGSAAMRSTPFHHWKCCIRHNTAEVCSYFTLLVCIVLWQFYGLWLKSS